MQSTCLLPTLCLWLAACLPGAPACARTQAPEAPAATHFLKIAATPMPKGRPAPGSVLFIGTATTLIRYQGITILTDPNFLRKGEHVHLGYGVRAVRLTDPALRLEQLPPIDLVLLSHLHEDHFDREVQRRLHRQTPIATTREAAARLGQLGFRRRFGLSPWDTLQVRKGNARLTVTALPARHGPPGVAALLPPVMGAMLSFSAGPDGAAYRIYISGDTVLHDRLEAIPRHFPAIDLALLHIGGQRMFGLAGTGMDGEDGASLLRLVAPERAIPLHFADYDMFTSPRSAFTQAARAAGLDRRIVYLNPGESHLLTAGLK